MCCSFQIWYNFVPYLPYNNCHPHQSSLQRRAPPTTFGESDMAYHLHWSDSCSCSCSSSSGSSRRRSSRSSRRETAATSTSTPAAMKIWHRLQNSSLTWMPNSLAAPVGFASFDANKTNQHHIRQFSKSEAAIDYPYLPPTYFCHQNCEKIISGKKGRQFRIIVGLR